MTEMLPLNLACLNGSHERCDGISTHEASPPGDWSPPECPCRCHYEHAFKPACPGGTLCAICGVDHRTSARSEQPLTMEATDA